MRNWCAGSVVASATNRSRSTLSAASEAELEVWGARRKRDLAEEVFDRKFKFTVERE